MRDDELHLKGYHIGSEGNRIVSDFWQLQIGHAHLHLHRTAIDAQTEKKKHNDKVAACDSQDLLN